MVTFNKSKSFIDNKSKRFLGIEIEVAYSNPQKYNILKNTIEKWHGDIGSDCSIEGNDPPEAANTEETSYEIRSAPTNGDLFIKQIMEYGYAFNATNTYANESCGLHVHIDARDLKPHDLDKVLILWSKVEPSMFNLVHPKRDSNSWCKRWNFTSDKDEIFEQINSSSSYNNKSKNKSILNKIKDGDVYLERYKSLNVCSLQDLGTLENRMHHGTTNPVTIINWAMINASLIDFAKAKSMEYIKGMPRSFGTLLATMNSKDLRKWALNRRISWKNRPVTTLYMDQIDDRKWYGDDDWY